MARMRRNPPGHRPQRGGPVTVAKPPPWAQDPEQAAWQQPRLVLQTLIEDDMVRVYQARDQVEANAVRMAWVAGDFTQYRPRTIGPFTR